ncbi:hypothetical protein [Terriglobus roseus]|uniref:Uncharacterized protein n=1 Tax=Terriglobus roseus TaxID=392734 RepID=A0A1H4JCQ1_9BACT|nr:hypothetical protein [Terriglobus roseus]SEB44084.1 hypothetical protein SAMN05443244_0530 [Terriglobus roseus]
MKPLFIAGPLLAFALLAQAQDAAPEAASETASETAPFRLVVRYDRPGLQVPHWQITVPLHGMAEYTGKPVKGSDPGQVLFRLSGTGRARLGTLMGRTHNLQPCETHSKGIANMGTKEVEYAAADGTPVRCAFNFTDNKPLSDALDYMLAIAGTVQAGLELDRLHRYDRLGLDPVMIRLTEDVKTGRAAELGAIRPTLESLATDVAVLERVRTRAQQLLTMVDQETASK